jgi:hypothetical protein
MSTRPWSAIPKYHVSIPGRGDKFFIVAIVSIEFMGPMLLVTLSAGTQRPGR